MDLLEVQILMVYAQYHVSSFAVLRIVYSLVSFLSFVHHL